MGWQEGAWKTGWVPSQRLEAKQTGTWIGWDCLIFAARDLATMRLKRKRGKRETMGTWLEIMSLERLRQGFFMKERDWGMQTWANGKKNQIYLTISKWLNTYWLKLECDIHDSGLVMCKPGSEDLKGAAATVERVIGITTHFCVHEHPPPHFLFHIQYGGLCRVLISMYRHTSPASCYFCSKDTWTKRNTFAVFCCFPYEI